MKNFKFEYIWLDGYTPDPNFRSKTKILRWKDYNGELEKLPMWSFDGSSTLQAEGSSSDCLLKPIRVYPDTSRRDAYLVLCEVLNADGSTHTSNARAKFEDDDDLWFGFEQEYVLMMNGNPLGFPSSGYPAPQGRYYCAVGDGQVVGRHFVEEHLNLALDCGIEITGINAEVMLGQWEYQVFAKGAKKAADDLMLSRYLLYRMSEKYGFTVNLHPKPVSGDWNGSGLHANFSNEFMRNVGGKELMTSICEAFGRFHEQHIHDYGSDNHLRLTGLHETQAIDKFSYGVSDRGASIRIPVDVARKDWKGYLEDRRPASNANPYVVAARIMEVLNSLKASQKKAA